jgi:outer membrane immunogenic protein
MSKHRGAARAALLAFTAFSAASAAATCANAADRPAMPVKASAPARPASWTQFYLGGGIGINAQTGRTLVTAGGVIGAAFGVEGFQGANLGLSATAGFDFQVSPLFVVGGFVDYDWSHGDTTLAVSSLGGAFSATALRLDGGWTIGGRAGVLLGTDVLLYGLGGFTKMRVNNWGIGTAGLNLQEPSLTMDGYTFGGGIEYRLASNVSLRAEYRHISLAHATTVDLANNLIWSNDITAHVGRLTAAYRFGGAGIATSAPTPEPSMRARPAAWTGFYGAAGIGIDTISRQLHTEIPGALALDASGLGGADVGGTFMAGFDYQFLSAWVAGVFGSFDLGNNGGAQFSIGVGGVPGAVVSTDLASVDKSWTAGGRLGYLVAPDALVYMLAGYTTTSFNPVSYNIFSQVTGTASLPDFHGITVGGGFEKLIFDYFSARAEYRNTRLETQSGYPAPGLANTSAQPTVNTVRFLLAYRLPTR